MPTRMMLELKHVDFPEVTIHLEAKLLTDGTPGSYASSSWIEQYNENPYTEIGGKLRKQLQTVYGIHVMYGEFGIMVQLPVVFDAFDTLWDIMSQIHITVDDDLLFATTLGDDIFIRPEFITNPDRQAFEENIEAALTELRLRKSRAIIEAEQTVERLVNTLERVQRS